MKQKTICRLFYLASCLLLACTTNAQQPSVEVFKQVFEAQMQKLLPSGYERRTISFVQVTPGKANSGAYPFEVTAYVHDYDEGYPPNNYYGATCLGKMDGWKFNLLKDDFGNWIVQGRLTVSDRDCRTNPAEGIESLPLADVPGVPYKKTNNIQAAQDRTEASKPNANLYVGEYACYGTGGRLMTGMGFRLLANGRYYDLDKQRGGAYTYNAQTATITFNGGFLSGQKGTGVSQSGFQLSTTVRAEPYR